MTETFTKSMKLTFDDGLPFGQRATFKVGKVWWIAVPMTRFSTMGALIDRLLGLHAGITREFIRWINARPQDAELVAMVLQRAARARTIHRELLQDKTKARTQ